MGDSNQIQPITTPARELHSKRSPSGYDWWGNCPGAPDYCEKLGLRREGGPAAHWGTMVHRIGEKTANYILDLGPKPAPMADDVKEVVEFYTNQLFAPDEPLCNCSPGNWVIGVEEKGNSPHLPHSSGTMDFVASCPVHLWLRVADLKTGFGEVEAQDNGQCAIYGVQALLSGKHRANRVVIEIIQPRSPSGRRVKRWTLSARELLEMLPVLQRKVAASLAPDAPLVAGEKQCKYCPAAAVCPERKKLVVEAAKMHFLPSLPPTPEQTARALNTLPELKDWIKSVESYAYQQANSGVKIPGYKLAQGRDGNREWADEHEVVGRLGCVLNEDQVYEKKIRSPAQMEKVLTKEGAEQLGKKTVKELVDSLCAPRKPGGTVLVEDADNRPAVVVDKLATFQHLLTK